MRIPITLSAGFVILLVCVALWFVSFDGPVFSQTNRHHDYQLLVSSLKGETEIVRNLLRSGADPNTPPGENDKGMTALMFAAWKGNDEIAGMLLEAGADPNAVADNGSSPLMYAASTGSPQIVRMLLSKGADPNYKRKEGMLAIMYGLTKNTWKWSNCWLRSLTRPC